MKRSRSLEGSTRVVSRCSTTEVGRGQDTGGRTKARGELGIKKVGGRDRGMHTTLIDILYCWATLRRDTRAYFLGAKKGPLYGDGPLRFEGSGGRGKSLKAKRGGRKSRSFNQEGLSAVLCPAIRSGLRGILTGLPGTFNHREACTKNWGG